MGTLLAQRLLSNNDRREWEKRMRQLDLHVAGFEREIPEEFEQPQVPLPYFEQWLRRTRLAVPLGRLLAAAGLNVTPQEALAFLLMTAAFLFAVGAIVTQSWLWSSLVGAMGVLLPLLIIRALIGRRRLLLERQLADALILISTSMQAGYGFMQGIRVASEQLPEPISSEFERVAFNVEMGMSFQAALQNLGARVQSYEFDMMISAVTTQMESGGSVTTILENIAETIRNRNALRDEIKAMTAQGKLSGIVLTALPIVLLIALSFINPKYAKLLFHDPKGQMVLKTALALTVVGWGMVRKILNVRL